MLETTLEVYPLGLYMGRLIGDIYAVILLGLSMGVEPYVLGLGPLWSPVVKKS